MARRLFDAFTAMELPGNWRNPGTLQPSLQKTQEFMATAMGYAGWRELSRAVQQPHEPVYVDTVDPGSDGQTILFEVVTKLTTLLGLSDGNGSVYDAVTSAGVGYSPRMRQRQLENSTPWGIAIGEPEELVPGIRHVYTASHGGLLLSPQRNSSMPPHLRLPDGAYADSGEFHLVTIAFAEEAEAMESSIRDALHYLGLIDPYDRSLVRALELLNRSRSDQDYFAIHFPTEAALSESDLEEEIIAYLVHCVRTNTLPIRFPGETGDADENERFQAKYDRYSLARWVQTYQGIPTVDGRWPTRPGPWYQHWAWQERLHEADAEQEHRFSPGPRVD
jgi:hypothetical protein